MGDAWKDLGKFTRKMDWWLPDERGRVARLSGRILWGPALEIHPVESHLFSGAPLARAWGGQA